MGGIAPIVELALAQLRSVDQQHQGLGKRLVLYLVPPMGAALTFGTTLLAAQRRQQGQLQVYHVRVQCWPHSWGAWRSALHLLHLHSERSRKHGDCFLSRDDLLVNALVGLVVFKALGGSCRNLMPSNINNPGALARNSIPARGSKYANEGELRLIHDLYRKHGCHHCGKRTGESIADHMPPNVVAHGRGWAKAGTPSEVSTFFSKMASHTPFLAPKILQQRLFPQCTDCMKIQSVALRHGKKELVFHFRRGIPEAPYFTGFCIGAMNMDELSA